MVPQHGISDAGMDAGQPRSVSTRTVAITCSASGPFQRAPTLPTRCNSRDGERLAPLCSSPTSRSMRGWYGLSKLGQRQNRSLMHGRARAPRGKTIEWQISESRGLAARVLRCVR